MIAKRSLRGRSPRFFRGSGCMLPRKILKIETGFQHELPPLLKEMKLTDIRHRWIVQYLTFTRRCHIRSAPPTACAKLSSTSHCHATRGNAHSYRPFRASRQAGSVSFSNRAPLLWNALTPEIRETSSHAAFKRRCLGMLQQNSEHEQFITLCLNVPEFG